jgi:hypothetical protein
MATSMKELGIDRLPPADRIALAREMLRWPGIWGPRGSLKWNPSKEPRHATKFKPRAHKAPSDLHG